MNCITFVFAIYFITIFTNGNKLEKVSVDLELFNMDIEDKCNDLTIVQKQFLLNSTNALSVKIETEKNIARFIKNETKRIRETNDKTLVELLPEPLQRLWSITMKMGDAELPEESWNKLISFKNSNDELFTNFQMPCLNMTKKCVVSKDDVIKILTTSRDAKELQSVWSALQAIYPKDNIEQFQEILKLIQKAAEVNDEQDAQHYWNTLVEWEDAYEKANTYWREIEPLYIKFHSFIKQRMEQYYSELNNATSIPVYLLGSEFGIDWSNIAPLVLPHRYLYDEISSMLTFDKIGGKKAYEIAEKFTTSMGFGKAGLDFWENSIFNKKCPSHLLTFCGAKYSSVVTCNATGWKEYLDAHEDMVRVTLNNMDYPAAAMNAYRISVLDEALAGLSSILALKNLPQAGIVPESVFEEEEETGDNKMAALMLTALRVLPRLPYYLLADSWRLQQLKGEDTEPVASWWSLRESMQRVKGVSNTEPDFLGDSYINSNKPYIGKFLGTILQFQLYEYFQGEMSDGVNILTHISNDENFKSLLKQRGDTKWHEAVYNTIYYDVDTDSLLNYFKPLEEYMDSAPREQVTQTVIPKTTTTTTTTTTPKPTTAGASVPKLPKDEPRNRSQNIRIAPVPPTKPPLETKVSVASTSNSTVRPTPPPASGSTTATWAGALIGIGALMVIVVVVGRKHCRRKPLPHNRRHDV